MSRDLAPPVVMRHSKRQKEPLPAIGHTTATTPQRLSDHCLVDASSHSPPLDESPTLVGSLSYARRRLAKQEGSAQQRTPSPHNDVGAPEGSAGGGGHPQPGRVKSNTRTQSALMDILDPDVDGSTVVVPDNVTTQIPQAYQQLSPQYGVPHEPTTTPSQGNSCLPSESRGRPTHFRE